MIEQDAGSRTRNKWRKFLRIVLALGFLAYVPSTPTGAATVTTTFLVTADVAVVCSISASQLTFGDYTPFGVNQTVALDGQSEITVVCTNSGTWVVGLDQGTFPGATVTTRRMKGPGASNLQYSLSSDAARSINWGNTVGVDTVSGTGTGGPQVVTVYGQVASGQTSVVPGGYSDTITATITF